MFLDLLKVPKIHVPLYIALTLVFWTSILKKSPLLLDFVLDFILLKAYIIRNFVLACGLVDFWKSRYLLYAEDPANLQLAYHFYTMQYYSNPLQKPCNFICKYNPFMPNNYFPLAVLPNVTWLLYLLAILAYLVLQQKHTLFPILQRRYRKNGIWHFTLRESLFAI